jgi:hypothetical protein
MFEPAPPDEPEPPPQPEPAAWNAPAAASPPPAREHPIYLQQPSRPGNGAATSSLVLGIIGIAVVILTLGIGFMFSLPASIVAWVMGARGRKRVATGQTTAGDGIAHAGVVLGIVGVILGAIGMVVWIALIASGLDLEELQRDLEQRSNPDLDQAVWAAAMALLGR